MAWLISKALMECYANFLSLPEGGVESWEDTCLAGEPCAQSSGKPIQLAYLPPDRMTKFSRLSRFGMTFKPLTESRGEDLLMWYREDFLAKTYPQQERAQESPAVNRVCGNTWHELLMKYDPDSHSWKTVRCLFPEELQWLSVTLPTWGMTASGALFQHQTLVRPINETGSGLKPNNEDSFHTPNTTGIDGGSNSRRALKKRLQIWPTPNTLESLPPKKLERIMEHNQKARPGRSYASMNLRELVVYGTQPIWPTPTANEDACGKPTGKMQKMLGNHPEVRQDPNGGVLNADWVEWLMGWPIGWTKLEPLESVTEFDETWWDVEPVPRVLIGATARADRLKAIGNGQVPAVAATAWSILR